jgi:sugar lactone lactonase YvrE
MNEARVLVDGLGFPESTRWRDGRAWVCNWGAGEVLAVSDDGGREVMARLAPQTIPLSIDWLPDGRMLVVDGGRTLIVADSHARQLVAFETAGDGSLTGRRVWADLEHAPDGICADADGALWVATVPGQRCVRVLEGGEILSTVAVDRGCFACMLGGQDGRTLYIAAAEWHGMQSMKDGPDWTGQLLAAPGQPAPHAGHP